MSGPDPATPEEPPALQQERTALAWDRTGLAVVVVGALFTHTAGPPFDDLRHLPGYLAMVFGAGIYVWALRHYPIRCRDLTAGRSIARPGLVRLVAAVVAALGVTAAVLIVS